MKIYPSQSNSRPHVYIKFVVFLLCLSVFLMSLLFVASTIIMDQFSPPSARQTITVNLSQISAVRSYLAATILTFPLIVFLLFSLRKDLLKNVSILDSGIFKFFYYSVFILPALLITGFLFSIISAVLEGNVTANLLILLIGFGSVIVLFGPTIFFFVSTFAGKKHISILSFSLLLSYYLLISVIIFVLAFIKLGPPWLSKNIRDDQNKITAANDISANIQDYFYQFKKLPHSLNELESAYLDRSFLKEAIANYSYSITGNASYKLCASFKMSSEELQKYGYVDQKYSHPSGLGCFDLTASTDFCRTLNTKMIVDIDKRGQIGCDIQVNGQINLSKSYCEGQKTRQKEFLVRDAYGRQNRYFATLTGLDMNEEVKIFAYTPLGLKIECLPSLNK